MERQHGQASSDADPHVLRASFDGSPELYERARPVAPSHVFDDLVALARLEPGARLVEIGCGTGQATVPLAERGFEIVGIELGERLAELARRKLAPFPARGGHQLGVRALEPTWEAL